MKKYIPIETTNKLNANYIEIDTYYDKGGYNVFTGEPIKRGYYVSVSPVNRDRNTTTYTAFTGKRKLIEETKRYSKKRMSIIDGSLNNLDLDNIDRLNIPTNMIYNLINHVCNEHGLIIERC